MKSRGLALGALLCLTGLTSIARADDKADIAALYHKVEKAMIAKDVKGILATGTKDFSYTEGGKTMSASQASAQMQQEFQVIQGAPKVKYTIISCTVKGKSATVETNDVTEMTMAGPDGKPHKLASIGRSKDLLVKTDKGWLMKTVNITSNKMTMDGKPFDPNTAAAGKK